MNTPIDINNKKGQKSPKTGKDESTQPQTKYHLEDMSNDSIGLADKTLPRVIHHNIPALELSGLVSSDVREEILSFDCDEEEKGDIESDPISGSNNLSLSNTLKKSSINPKLQKYNDKIS